MSLGKEWSSWRGLAPAHPGRRTRPLNVTRGVLKHRLFRLFDKDADGFLSRAEMRSFVEHVGFEGSDAEWSKEYRLLCSDHRLDPARGMTLGAFVRVLDDKSEMGLHCSDDELCLLLGIERVQARPGADRDEGEDGDEFVRVFFAGANFNTTEAVLKSTFGEVGTVEEFTLFRLQDGKSMGMGRVRYSSHGEARRALAALHNREVDGRALMLQVDQREGGNGDQREGGNGEAVYAKRTGGEEAGPAGRKGGEEARASKHKGKDKGTRIKAQGNKDKGKGHGADRGSEGSKGHSDQDWYEGGWSTGAHEGASDSGDYRTIFFSGASSESSEACVRSHFQEVGDVVQFWLFSDSKGCSRGMGVAQYRTAWEANRAVERFSGTRIGGKKIVVKIDTKGHLDQARGKSDGRHEWDSGWEGGIGGDSSSGWKGGGDGGWKGGWEGGYGGRPIGGRGDSYDGWKGGWEGGRGRSGRRKGGRENGGRGGGGRENDGWEDGGWEEGYDGGWEDGYDGGRRSDENEGRGSDRGGGKEVKYTTQGVNLWCEVKREGWHKSARVFFSGAPVKMARAAVQQHFAEFGVVRSLTIFRSGKTSRGMGVCCYQGANAAEAAINYGVVIDGQPLYLQQLRRREGREGWEQDQEDLNPNKSVFFSKVPLEIAETFLKEKFGSVGEIRNFMLFTSPDGRSRGMGVVEYFTAESAERAYNEFHDMTVSGKPMHVDYFSF